MGGVGRGYRELEASTGMHCQLTPSARGVYSSVRDEPLDFNSCVHPRSSSAISSGPTSVRVHGSVHTGSFGATFCVPFCFACFLLLSLLRKTLEKNDMIGDCLWVAAEGIF